MAPTRFKLLRLTVCAGLIFPIGASSCSSDETSGVDGSAGSAGQAGSQASAGADSGGSSGSGGARQAQGGSPSAGEGGSSPSEAGAAEGGSPASGGAAGAGETSAGASAAGAAGAASAGRSSGGAPSNAGSAGMPETPLCPGGPPEGDCEDGESCSEEGCCACVHFCESNGWYTVCPQCVMPPCPDDAPEAGTACDECGVTNCSYQDCDAQVELRFTCEATGDAYEWQVQELTLDCDPAP